jgi:hypothetical protein
MFKVSNKVRASVFAAAFGLLLTTTSFATSANAVTIKMASLARKMA